MPTHWTTNPYAGQKVAVLGDAMVDRFVYGEVDRISPEAPVPVVRVTKRTTHLGGAGNTAYNLKSLGAEPLLITRMGKDIGGEAFCEIAEQAGISTDYLIEGKVWSILKSRIIARHQQVVRYDEEEIQQLTKEELEVTIEQLQKVRKQADVIVVSDYAKGMITQGLLDAVKEIWADGIILVDPKPRDDIDYTGVTGIKPNLMECCKILGMDHAPKSDLEAADVARQMCEKFDLKHILLTRSGDGMTLWNEGRVDHLHALAKEIVDVSGAGDTVMSAFAAGISAGLALPEAADLANVAGGIVVEKLGTASVSWQDIEQALEKTKEVA